MVSVEKKRRIEFPARCGRVVPPDQSISDFGTAKVIDRRFAEGQFWTVVLTVFRQTGIGIVFLSKIAPSAAGQTARRLD